MDLKELYTDPKFPASFTGKQKFSQAVRSRDRSIKNSDVEKTLEKIDAYTLHKPTQREPLYRRIYTKGINYLFQCDLVDLAKHGSDNDGFKYIITVIDTFSKRAWAFPLKTKTTKEICKVMSKLFKKVKCKKIEFDKGGEFVSRLFKKLLQKHKIKYYHVHSDRKAAIVERFNKTLKWRMSRYNTKQGGHRWVDNLQDVINAYNATKHSSIGFAPNDVNKRNEKLVRRILYPPIIKERKHVKPAYKLNDSVRIAMKKRTFQKGYDHTYSYEVFEVSEILDTYPVTYKIRDYKGEQVLGCFYKRELQKVDKSDNIWPINKVLGTVKRRGRTYYRVNYLGYPDDFTDLIPQSDLFTI